MKKFVSLLLAIVLAAGALIAAPIQLRGLVVSASAEEATTQPETTTPETTEPEGSGTEEEVPIENYLYFTLDTYAKCYHVSISNTASGEVVIPATYNNLPVTRIFTMDPNDSVTALVMPDTINSLGDYAFNNASALESVTLSKNLKDIPFGAFEGCTSLKSIDIPEGVQTILDKAFYGCSSLSSISIPDSVAYISQDAFFETDFYKNPDNWENGVLYSGKHLLGTNQFTSESYRVKEGTIHIASRAFYNCKNLVSLYIPKSVKIINGVCFQGCENLAFIFYSGTAEDFSRISFDDNESDLQNTLVILEASGTGIPAKATVKSVSNAAGGVLISWNPVENADAYVVWRRGAGTNDWTLLGITNETSAIDTSAEHRKFWRYSVQAMNADGLSDFDYTGKYLKYIETPELTGISNVKNGLKFTWKAVSGATGYRVYRRGAGAKGWRYLGTVKGTSYTDTGVRNANGGYYRYTARAVVDKRYSGYEDFLYLKRLSNPTLKSAKSTGNGILVDWGSVKGSTGYYVYRKTAGSSWTRIATVKGVDNSAYTDTTAKKGVTYTYTVRAYSGKARSHYYSGIKCTR